MTPLHDVQVESMCNLGKLLLTGAPGLPKDETEGYGLVLAAAERSHAPAQFNVALCFDRGIGVEKSPAEALKWLRKAAGLSFLPALKELGTVLRTGSLGEINEAEAVECDRLVAAAST